MDEIAPGIYIELDYRGANVGFMATDEGAIAVDTPILPEQARHWRGQMERVTGKPLLYMINTDHHRGHIMGNQFFLPAPIVAHERAWRDMRGYGDNFKQRVIDSFKREPALQAQFSLSAMRIIRPQITFSRQLTLRKGGRELRVIHIGGHTMATSIVWLPKERVLFVGDTVWIEEHPYMAQSSASAWMKGLERIRELDPAAIIAGHGPVCGLREVEYMMSFLSHMRERVQEYYENGVGKHETGAALVEDLRTWFHVPQSRRSKIHSQIKSGVGRTYEEVRKADQSRQEAKGVRAG
jgi:cyclase